MSEERLFKQAVLLPGEPYEEVRYLLVTADLETEGFYLKLHVAMDQPSIAEYWFATWEKVDSQARMLFGTRFEGWQEPF
jgi:hypothetical protein